VAKINPVKVKQDADKEEKAGRLDKAILLYRQILDENPKDWNTVNKIGDLYAKMNRYQEASSEYAKVADFYARDGFLLKAIALWKKINRLDASALDPYLNLAELYSKQGLAMEAKSQYQIVVDEYVKRGKTREAGDVLRKMAEIDPSDLKIRSKLADLYTREGNTGKAVEEHIAIAEELSRKGHPAEALQVLEKGLKIDATSPRLRGELARAYVLQKNFEKAAHYLPDVLRGNTDVASLVQLGEAYLASNRVADAEKVFARLVELQPDNPETRVQMGRLCLARNQFDRAFEEFQPVVDQLVERNQGERAAPLLQAIVQKSPTHVRTLVKLVELYRQLKSERQVAATYSQLVEAYVKSGELEGAASVLEILVSMEPQNQQHASKLQFVRGKLGGAPQADEGSGVELDLPGSEEMSFESEPAALGGAAPRAADAGGGTAAAIELSGPLSDEDQEFIEEHLAEGKVFRKYGLIDKAADQFEAIVARFPDHVETRQELLDVYKEKEENAKAGAQAVALVQIHRLNANAEAAEAALAEAQALAPELVTPEIEGRAAPAPAEEVTFAPQPEAAPLAEEELSLSEDLDIPLEVEEGGLEAEPLEPEPAAETDLGLESVEALGEEAPAPEADLSLDTSSLDLGGGEMGLEEPASAAASDDLGLGLELGGEEPPPAPPVEPPPPLAAPLQSAPRAAAKPASGLPADLQKVLDEFESYMSLGFVDDAKDALREVAAKYPSHPAILAKMAEHGVDLEAVEEEAPAEAPAAEEPAFEPMAPEPPSQEASLDDLVGGAPEPPSFAEASLEDALADITIPEQAASVSIAEPPPVPDGGIDLGAELGELFGAQTAVAAPEPESAESSFGDAGLAEMFQEFKKGVDKQLGKEDYDTRYNLGIAYKEMGLVDEAIAEFQLAAKDENRMLECSSMLGICFMDKGMPKLAVKWFEKGLKAPGRSEEEYQGLRYDLAGAYEAAGETDSALAIFEDLYGQDANFRDVAHKLRELKAALG
jgi:pilus assembly protein FimV